ncbi:phytoene synthase [Cnuibacter physcomitrellae]|uniref:Phytoene synthase n=1 Tax=Cnuibacter physcomitrellae TaxID=1619308 RepID=A0A1X9LRP8_9MICO|nr:squalene/phytoene synthase family protein [Cnuibacter physcomitrellae]ARJ06998.1 phytoene synthase [Cnuibacter physcomitrellae]GGI39320.1 phytoene synthase [Cnuibacter physcomitrellae]
MTEAARESQLSLYDRVAVETAAIVIRRYSTSFGLAARLLGPTVRRDVENIYALVRIADEVVDGLGESAHLDADGIRERLDALEAETEQAIRVGYSTNLIVHAFALTSRQVGIGTDLTRPFFRSMRADITRTAHDRASFDDYVYGSAEVVGLMCLAAFLRGVDVTPSERARLETGAKHLGAAFQKINFLRDLAADFRSLGRSYFPDVTVESFTEAQKAQILAEIDDDLACAARCLPGLPPSSRRAVALAQGLFEELATRLRDTPAATLMTTRIRVPNPVKARIAAGAAVGRLPRAVEKEAAE